MDLLDARKNNLFDKVLLDAPCSSEGLVRKDFTALKEWNQTLVWKKSDLQKNLIRKSLQLLKKGGELVYSTCSLSPEENEEVINMLVEEGKTEVLETKIKNFKTRNGLTNYNGKKYDSSLKKCVRIYPQDNDSQAFFIAKITKTAT